LVATAEDFSAARVFVPNATSAVQFLAVHNLQAPPEITPAAHFCVGDGVPLGRQSFGKGDLLRRESFEQRELLRIESL